MNIAYILLIILIWISDDSFMFGVNDNNKYIISKYVLYIFLIIWLSFRNIKLISKNNIILLVSIFILIIGTALFNMEFTGGYIYQCITIYLSFLIAKEIDFKLFSNIFCKLMYIVAIISLVGYAITLTYPSILDFFPLERNISNNIYRNLYLVIISLGDGFSIPRNTGIFREPGVYMIYLNFAIMLTIYYNSTINKKHLIAFIICIITSASTAGIIICGILLILSSFLKNKNLKIYQKISFIIIIVAFFSVFLLNEDLFNKVFDKMDSSHASHSSTISRIASIFVPIKIFFDYPIFGSGLSTFVTEFYKQSYNIYGVALDASGSSTNTIINKFATYGFTFGILSLYSIYKFSKKITINHQKILSILIFTIFLAMLSNEDLRYSLLFNVIAFYGFLHSSPKKNSL